MTPFDLIHADDVCKLLHELTQKEGNSVELCHENPEFGGPRCTVLLLRYDDTGTRTYGDTVLDCLRALQDVERTNDLARTASTGADMSSSHSR